MKDFFYKKLYYSPIVNISNIQNLTAPAKPPDGYFSLISIQVLHVKIFLLGYQKTEGFYFVRKNKLESACPWPTSDEVTQKSEEIEKEYNQSPISSSQENGFLEEVKRKISENMSTKATLQERAIFFVTIILALLGAFYSINLKEITSIIEKNNYTLANTFFIITSILLLLQILNSSLFSYILLKNKPRVRSTIKVLTEQKNSLLFNNLIDFVATRREAEALANYTMVAQSSIKSSIILIIITSIFIAFKDIKPIQTQVQEKEKIAQTITLNPAKKFELLENKNKRETLLGILKFKSIKTIYLIHNLSDREIVESYKNALTNISEQHLITEIVVDQPPIKEKFIIIKVEGMV